MWMTFLDLKELIENFGKFALWSNTWHLPGEVELSSQEQLMHDLFPKAKFFWRGRRR
jgi:hypothetical protein